MSTSLSNFTISALTHKADVAADELSLSDPDDDSEYVAEWIAVEAECLAVAALKTVEALSAFPVAQEELDNYVTSDLDKKERRAILADMCRAGLFETRDSGEVVRIGSPAVYMRVDGVQYDVGSYK